MTEAQIESGRGSHSHQMTNQNVMYRARMSCTGTAVAVPRIIAALSSIPSKRDGAVMQRSLLVDYTPQIHEHLRW